MKRWRLLCAGIAILLACVVGRCAWESRREYKAGTESLARGETGEGIIHLDRAIHGYFPLNPYVDRSVRALWTVGQESEDRNPALALRAYEAIRGALNAVRGIYQPYSDWLPKTDEKIASLRTLEEVK